MGLAERGQTGTQSHALARFGTPDTPLPPTVLSAGSLRLLVADGAVRRVTVGDTEVVRGIDMPVRDANWATAATRTLDETIAEDEGTFAYRRKFDVADGQFSGVFTLQGTAEPLSLTATVELTARRDACVNRAGFVVLHPLKGVVGTPLTRTRPDGRTETLSFPANVSPGQPVFDIAALAHEVDGVGITMTFEGDVFEMEDQRNWTDASYKTYCRPLGLPRPFNVAAGERIEQRIAMTFTPAASDSAAGSGAEVTGCTMPAMEVALDEAIAPLPPAATAVLARLPFAGAQVRLTPETAAAALQAAVPLGLPVALEIVLPADAVPADALAKVASAAAAAGVRPVRVLALPEPYLASHQPDGPWPTCATPAEAAEAARAAFPDAEIAAGMLTNFTELNRCPPVAASDVVSFGTTAIVHAADDMAVLETLEALPSVFETAKSHAGDRPVRLGLSTIGMRSNPYGAAVADNPRRERVAMAMDDPRHGALFAAAFATGSVAAAARAGIASLAPAMASGPLGLVAGDDRVLPLFHVVRALSHLSGAHVRARGGLGGLVSLTAERHGLTGIAANLGDDVATVAHGRAVLLSADSVPAAMRDPDWLANAPRASAPVTLAPLDVAFLFGDGDEL